MHGDGEGLYLKCKPQPVRGHGCRESPIDRAPSRNRPGVDFLAIGLAQAREAAAKHRSLIAAGADPIAEKRKAAVPTFRAAAERTFEANKPR